MALTPPDIVRSAYAELVVTDLGAAREFWVDLLGFHVECEESDALYLRGYEEFVHHSLVLRRGPIAACARIAFRVRTADDVELAARWYEAADLPVRRIPAGATTGVGEAVRVIDPLGFTVEFFHDIAKVDRLVQAYHLRRGASISRIDHINIAVPDVPKAYEYYSALNFGLSETIEGDAGELYAAWMYRKQTVHDIAFTQGSGPRLHHLGYAVPESHNVFSLCDTLGSLNRQSHIERGPGRHGVSNAFYVYLRDPDGHRIEIYTSDYFTGDPGHEPLRWSVHDDRRRDYWGNAVVPGWYTEASTFADLDGNPTPVLDRPSDEQRITIGADGHGMLTE